MTLLRRDYSAWLCLALFVGCFFVLSARNGPDANWDLRNYHLYGPFALLHGKLGYDIAPAQRQTFLAPQLDLIPYWLRNLLNDWPGLLQGILSIPHAVSAFLAFLIARRFLMAATPGRTPLALLAAAIGATGAGALPTLGQSLSEMVPGAFCLVGLWLLLRLAEGPAWMLRSGLGGASFGMAAALKLTAMPFCVAAALALLIAPALPLRRRLMGVVVFGLAGALTLLAVAGPWWAMLYAKYGSPLFPFYNNVFRSPDFAAVALTDGRFLPKDALQAMFYPFFWAVRTRGLVTELDMRDPRLAVAYVAIMVTGARIILVRPRADAPTVLFTIFFCVAYVLWETVFSIYRYAAPLEFLAPVSVLVMLRTAGRSWRWAPWIAMVALAGLCWRLTVYPDWGHAPRGGPAVHVVLPPLPDDALVVMLDGAPMAYVAAFAPPSVRFVGANNNLVSPGQDTVIAHQVQAAIRAASGPIWGLEDSTANPAIANGALAFYGLHAIGECVKVISNLDASTLRLCPLGRD